MARILRISLLMLIFCITNTWTIHVVVPEHLQNSVAGEDTLEMKRQHNLVQQSIKYAINSNNNSSSSTTTTTSAASSQINAMLAKNQLPHTSYDKNYDVVMAPHGRHNNGEENNKNKHFFESLEAAAQSNDNDNEGSQAHKRNRRELSDWLIAPNTRWCGRGNSANGTYNHLGGASMADKCCRKHDHCKLFIPGMSNRYGIFNYRPYTLSHCSCDRRFRTCLKMANDEDAKTIGQLFFNMVQTQCFILAKEKVCHERAADGSCAQEHTKQKAYLRNNKKF
ncbi:group 3 secretory phospholipase A2 [Stomoxys calcitrans]|uniref:phospholipase A2 n=1 Tax=Stomoxys calcitrans TaxID=35570 RepID=A0A1I8PQX9_STOCA|nr:group 3 secretory phospholipase A2 [Stomoxys calcitrans]